MKLTNSRVICLLVTVSIMVVVVGGSNASWPMFRKDITHDAQLRAPGAEDECTAWTYTITPPSGWPSGEALTWSSPIIADSSVFVATRHGYVYCFDLADGDSLWAVQVADTISSTPTVSDGKLYVLGGISDRKVHCIETEDGDDVWESMALGAANDWNQDDSGSREWVEASPLVVDDSDVYVGARNGVFYRLDAADGDTVWTRKLGMAIWSSAAYVDDKLYVGSYGTVTEETDSSGVYCLDADDGEILWMYHYKNGNAAGTMGSPTIYEDRLFVGTNRYVNQTVYGGALVCLDTMPDAGRPQPPEYERYIEEVFATDIWCDVRCSPVVLPPRGDDDDEWIYFSSGKGIYAVDEHGHYELGTDAEAGIKPAPYDEYWSSPSVAAWATRTSTDTLLFVGAGGSGGSDTLHFFALNTELETQWSYSMGQSWASPALAPGKVVTCSNSGTVYCFITDPFGGGQRVIPPDVADDLGREDNSASLNRTSSVPTEPAPARASYVENHPDPFREATSIRFGIDGSQAQQVSLTIYDVNGRLIRLLVDDELMAGDNVVNWDGIADSGSRVSAGVYYYTLRIGEEETSKQMLLVR